MVTTAALRVQSSARQRHRCEQLRRGTVLVAAPLGRNCKRGFVFPHCNAAGWASRTPFGALMEDAACTEYADQERSATRKWTGQAGSGHVALLRLKIAAPARARSCGLARGCTAVDPALNHSRDSPSPRRYDLSAGQGRRERHSRDMRPRSTSADSRADQGRTLRPRGHPTTVTHRSPSARVDAGIRIAHGHCFQSAVSHRSAAAKLPQRHRAQSYR